MVDVNGKANRVVLVTGGGKGVGRGISESFLRSGAEVVICGRTEPESLPEVSGRSATFIPADVRDLDAVERLFSNVRERHGRLDVLVNNVGGTPFAMAADASTRYHESILALNLTAPLCAALKANAIMQSQPNGGVIVFIGSISAVTARPGSATYAAAKAAILSLTKSLAVEWAPKVRVVSVSPGLIQTEQSHLHYGDSDGIEAVARTIPLGRMGMPQDIGDACVFMASEQAAYVSGVDLLVHGGGERPAFLEAANVNQQRA
ncbi:SDR family oxidoreductase [Paraburkholderia sacchari]|uniref:SDR family oxidoreductase n=1 Tax=Paraburkholderia sacchari TaxID=159450 RepID=UPI000543D709|nr:SDR family oxidoreductase [Paraburkholderia sacchari]NLP64881.1 SDR family oxidoreductase [Paraburkholderia sacchari]